MSMARRTGGINDSESSYFSLSDAIPAGLRGHSGSVDSIEVYTGRRAVIRADEGTEDPREEDGVGVGLALTGGVAAGRSELENGLKVMRDGSGGPTLAGVRERSISETSSSDESMGGNAKLSAPFIRQMFHEATIGSAEARKAYSGTAEGGDDRGETPVLPPSKAEGALARYSSTGGGGGGRVEAPGLDLQMGAWMADSEVAECMNGCGVEFSAWERRHHCRRCGGIFCNNCCKKRTVLAEPLVAPGERLSDRTRPHRVCNSCHQQLQVESVLFRDGKTGVTLSGARERSTSAASSSSDESMGALPIKQLFQAARNGQRRTVEVTPEQSRRNSADCASADGESDPTGAIHFPSPEQALGTRFASSDDSGVLTRRKRSGSVGGGRREGAISTLTLALGTVEWVADGDVSECMNACGVEFNAWERRHHCRSCGGIYCHDCSRSLSLIPVPLAPPGRAPPNRARPHRVCNSCRKNLQPRQEELRKKSRERHLNTDSPSRFCELPFGVDLAQEVRKSARTLKNFLATRDDGSDCDGNVMGSTERRISNALCEGARGLVILTVGKVGFLYGVEGGTGLCMTRLFNGEWSAPSAVGTFGLSWGFQAGCEVVEMVIPLKSDAAVEMLKSGGKVYVEVDAGFAIGSMGRNVSSAVGARAWPGEEGSVDLAARYSLSKGLFAGVGVGAGFLRVMDRVNERFYRYQISPRDLLDGVIPRPQAAGPLYSSLARLERVIGGEGRTTVVGDGGRRERARTVERL